MDTEELVADSPLPQRAAIGQLMILSQSLGKIAAELMSPESQGPEAIFLLGKDTDGFDRLMEGLLKGNAALRLQPARTPSMKQRLTALQGLFDATKRQVEVMLADFKHLDAARDAQAELLVDIEALDVALKPGCFGGN